MGEETALSLGDKVAALSGAVQTIAEAQATMNARLDEVRGYLNSLTATGVLSQEQANALGSNIDAAIASLNAAITEASANLSEAGELTGAPPV